MLPLFAPFIISVLTIRFYIPRTIKRVPLHKPFKIDRLRINITIRPCFNFNLRNGKPDGVTKLRYSVDIIV